MIDENKEQHMLMVAKYMHDRAEDYGLESDEMYVLGLLHDIGYLEVKKGHSKEGMKLLRKLHFKPEFCFAVRHHGDYLSRVQSRYRYMPKELVLLIEADLSVDFEGRYVGFIKRAEDIARRYGNAEIARKNARFIRKYWKYHNIPAPDFGINERGLDVEISDNEMRDFTKEEAKNYEEFLDGIYKPTGQNILDDAPKDDFDDDFKDKSDEDVLEEDAKIASIPELVPGNPKIGIRGANIPSIKGTNMLENGERMDSDDPRFDWSQYSWEDYYNDVNNGLDKKDKYHSFEEFKAEIEADIARKEQFKIVGKDEDDDIPDLEDDD